jgi:dolichol-phosphate mannosyltransferase
VPSLGAVVVSPTYNEAENIEWFLRAVRAAAPMAHIMIVDDNSPDGTGDIAERVAAEIASVTVLHRSGKLGLGSAYRHAFEEALAGGYDVVVSMDCDRSHDPTVVPQLIAAVEGGADLAIGSRYVPGGGTANWPMHRRLLSKWGNRYTGALLGFDVHDATSGFRAYRAATLAAIEPGNTAAEGYAFLYELVRRFHGRGSTICELPIVFVDRTYGRSKMSARIVVESMVLVTRWGLSDRLRSIRSR